MRRNAKVIIIVSSGIFSPFISRKPWVWVSSLAVMLFCGSVMSRISSASLSFNNATHRSSSPCAPLPDIIYFYNINHMFNLISSTDKSPRMNNATAKQFPVPASIRLFSLAFVNNGIFDADQARKGLLFGMKIWIFFCVCVLSVKWPASSHDALSCCRTDKATLCRFVNVSSLKIKSIRHFLSLKCFDLVGSTALALVALVAGGGGGLLHGHWRMFSAAEAWLEPCVITGDPLLTHSSAKLSHERGTRRRARKVQAALRQIMLVKTPGGTHARGYFHFDVTHCKISWRC